MDFYITITRLINKRLREFQSLFYWIMDFYHGDTNLDELKANLCFNPCFTGLWIFTGLGLTGIYYENGSFNPCFTGLWIFT